MDSKTLSNAGFLNPAQKQHYAHSHIEFVAHRLVGGLKVDLEFRNTYTHVLFYQDQWLNQFELYKRKKNDVLAQAFVTLYDDVVQRKVSNLDEFYARFNKLLKPKRGRAAKLQKRTNAGIRGAIERAGVEAIDNPNLFKAIHRLAAKLSHTRTADTEINDLLDALIKQHHLHSLSNKQRNDLHQRLLDKIAIMEQQISEVEAKLLRMRDKAGKPDKIAAKAYHLYGLVKLEVAVGETIGHNVREWAERVPFGPNAITEPLAMLVKFGALEEVEAAKQNSYQGKTAIYKRLV